MDIIERLIDQATASGQTVVFPEGEDPRILIAARHLRDRHIAAPILLGDIGVIDKLAQSNQTSLDGITLLDPQHTERMNLYAQRYVEQRPKTSMKIAQRLMRKPLFFAAMMVHSGDAAATVAGVDHPTSRVIEAGMLGIGLTPGIRTPSSFFLMVMPEFRGRQNTPLMFADCAVNIEPTAEQLADVAIASAVNAEKLLDEPPRVAFLSFSTQGSAQHELVKKVQQAADIARHRAPRVAIDGEFQADSALIPEIAAKKLRFESQVAGHANVLIFPDLNSGNIAYKLTQYLANAQAIGPVLQGFAKPLGDLSRGASKSMPGATLCSRLQLALHRKKQGLN
jgi:phosphate acetyltransferase